ncbi:MAG: succinate dehydrogenase/fumarate reductase cytochrome b subunit [Thermodesulfobacteriota bacterium]
MAHIAKLPLTVVPRRAPFLWDLVSSVTGIALAVYIVAHMLLVGSVLLGVETYNSMAHALEASGVAQVDGPLVFAVFLLHFVAAVRKVPLKWPEQVLAVRQARLLRHSETWLWLAQAASGMLLLVLGAIHMWSVLTDLPITAAKSGARVADPAWFILYLFLVVTVCGHAAAGVYRSGVKWGGVLRSKRWTARRLILGSGVALGLLGLVTLARFLFV